MVRKRRLPGKEELALWRAATQDVQKWAPAESEPSFPVDDSEPAAAHPVFIAAQLRKPKEQPAAFLPLPRSLDTQVRRRIDRGQTGVDARLDLHGMTTAEAHAALIDFVLQAIQAGHRIILVITGKGRFGQGILRQNLPLWLEAPLLRPHLSAIEPALQRHGGEGAFYIQLKRVNNSSVKKLS